jgi:hypothetical protein
MAMRLDQTSMRWTRAAVSWNIAELQIGVSNDGGGGPPWPIEAAGASGSQSLDKLHLANWP